MALERRLIRLLRSGGCVGAGIAGVAAFGEVVERAKEAVESGRSAGLGFTFRNPETAGDITATFPWARSLVVGAYAYLPAGGSPGPMRRGGARIARFATADHYAPLRDALQAAAVVLRREGFEAEVLVDDSRLFDRAAALRAGVGWAGKSTLVLVPGAGPWVLLGSVVTDAPLAFTSPMSRSCGSCTACIPACPTGAIVAPGVLDARRCLSALLQMPGWIPHEIRPLVGDRLYGCDDCLEACPPGLRLLSRSNGRAGSVEIVQLLKMSDSSLRARFPHFFVPGNEGRWLRRNAIVALGNTGGPDAPGILSGYAGHHDSVIRGHAVWALGRVGGTAAATVLRELAASEAHARVNEEVERALGTLQ